MYQGICFVVFLYVWAFICYLGTDILRLASGLLIRLFVIAVETPSLAGCLAASRAPDDVCRYR
jgi:hypothetical protein